VSDLTPRERLEQKHLNTVKGQGVLTGAVAGRRIALALLDVADAIREHTAAMRELDGKRPAARVRRYR
jgi:hypothetical protein